MDAVAHRRIYVALFVSGVAALVYELLWVRLLGELFGHTIYAVQTVLAIFFAGVAGGSRMIASILPRIRFPARALAMTEVALAICGALLPSIVHAVTPLYDRFAPLQTETSAAVAARLAVTLLVLIVPTTLMGATFPLAIAATGGRRVPAVYGLNTLGGALGVVLTAFIALPLVGVRGTLAGAVIANVLAAALAWSCRHVPSTDRAAPEPRDTPRLFEPRVATAVLFVTGATALALELLWTRALEQILSGTIFTFAVILAVFLAGIGGGSLLLPAVRRSMPPALLIPTMLLALAVLVAATPMAVVVLNELHASVSASFRGSAAAALESAIAGALLLPPALLIGLLFPAILSHSDHSASSVGRLTAANTLGSVIGPLVAGMVVLPVLGLRGAIVVFAVIYGVLAGVAAASLRAPRLASIALAVTAVVGLGAVLLTRPIRIWGGQDERLIAYRDDTAATVAVVERDGERRLKVNNTYSLGGGKGIFTERRQGHLPMFLHDDPQRVLVLGIGTGNTLGAVALHRPRRLVAVDLLPGVIDFARRHFHDTNYGVIDDAGVEVVTSDATRIARSSADTFDVVIGDLFHPWQAGVSALYSAEHFAHVRERIGPGGIFVQWLPVYQLSTEDLRCITRTFLHTFPHAQAWFGNFGISTPVVALVGSNAPIELRRASWRARVADLSLGPALREVYLDQEVELYASYVCDRPLLEQFGGSGPINRLDHPVIEFSAAETLFADSMRAQKQTSLKEMVKLAAAQDRLDRTRGVRSEIELSNRLGIRAFIVAFLAMEQGGHGEAADAALIAAEKCVSYELPRKTLVPLGWELLSADPVAAERVFRAATHYSASSASAWSGLARTLNARGKNAEAREAAVRAADLEGVP